MTSIANFDYDDQLSVIYTLSRDSKLRTWSAASGQYLKSTDVRVTPGDGSLNNSPVVIRTATPYNVPSLSSEQPATSICIVPHPHPSSRCSHIVVVFVPSPYDPSVPGTFVFYRASGTTHGVNDLEYAGSRPGSSASAGSHLRGFEIEPPTRTDAADGWRLWAVWDSKGTLSADSVVVNDILQFTTYLEPQLRPAMVFDWLKASVNKEVERFDNSYFDNIVDLENYDPLDPYGNGDIVDIFLEHLFYPGRFSYLTLTTALDDYIDQLPASNQSTLDTNVYASLPLRFEAAVGSALALETNTQTGAPETIKFRKDLKQQWQGVWARVRELDKQARWPVSTASVNGQLLILDRDGASAPIQLDTPGVLVQLGCDTTEATEFQSLPEGSLKANYPALAPPQARRGLTALAVAGETVTRALENKETEVESAVPEVSEMQNRSEPETQPALEALLNTIATELSGGLSEPVEVVGNSLWDDHVEPFLGEQDKANLERALTECTSISKTLSEALDVLATFPQLATGDKVNEALTYSGFGNALLTSTIAAVAASRFALARDVLLIALYFTYTTPIDDDDDQAEEYVEVLARAFATYHRYTILHTIMEQHGLGAAKRARARRLAKRLRGKDDVLAEFDSLKMREGDDEPADADGYSTEYSLVHSLVARVFPQPVPTDTVASLFDSACTFLSSLDLLESDQIDLEPRAPDVKLAYAILADGHAEAAETVAGMYPSSSGMAFVCGRAALEFGSVEEGVRQLELASAGCRGEPQIMTSLTTDGSLAVIMPTCTGKKGLGEYYRRVMAVVDEHGLEAPVAHFGNLALQSIECGEETTRDIWTRVFLAYLTLGRYEDAYSTLTSAPFHDMWVILQTLLTPENGTCLVNSSLPCARQTRSAGSSALASLDSSAMWRSVSTSRRATLTHFEHRITTRCCTRGTFRAATTEVPARSCTPRASGLPRPAHPNSQRTSSLQCVLRVTWRLSTRFPSSISGMRGSQCTTPPTRLGWVGKCCGLANVQSQKSRKVTTYIPEDEFSPDVQAVNIITLADMRAEYTAVLSQLRLSQQIQHLHEHGVSLTPEEIVGFFTQRSMFDEAQSSAAAMNVDMTDMFVTLAARCVELARAPGVKLDNPSASFLAASPITSRLRGPPSALALRYLQVSLERHDSAATQWKYRTAVADAFFSLNNDALSGWQVPVWLVETELSRDPENWISKALSYGWISEAISWSREVLRRATPPDLLLNKPDAIDIPYNLFDRVLAAGESDEDTKKAAEGLRTEIQRRIGVMKSRE